MEKQAMFGFLVGAACLGGLFALTMRRPRFGSGHFGHFGHRSPWYAILRRLDTTPGQEKVIRSAVADFMDSAWTMRSKVQSSRSEIADALRAETFDAERIRGVVSQHVEELITLGTSFGVSLGRVHEALDHDQRQRLARLIESHAGGPCLRSTPFFTYSAPHCA
ncbi:MAG TPA: periplasmic heavy metal sensor [Polyangiaceae bacterium]|nr:periplasmic heavy metal sensor [Polyangiaceae bacterium]